MNRYIGIILLNAMLVSGQAQAVGTHFFDGTQAGNLVESGPTFETIASQGYLFTYTVDRTVPNPWGADHWPNGLHVEPIYPPLGPHKAEITIRREDNSVFDITSFTVRLFELDASGEGLAEFGIVPSRNGEDLYNDTLLFRAGALWRGLVTFGPTVIPGTSSSNNFGHTTAKLKGADTYKINTWGQFGLKDIILSDASLPPPQTPVPLPGAFGLMLTALSAVTGLSVRRRSRDN